MTVRPVDDLLAIDTPLLVLPLFEGEDAPAAAPPAGRLDDLLSGALERARRAGDLSGKDGRAELLHAGGEDGGPRRLLILGLGPRGDCDAEAVRTYAGRAVRAAEERELESLAVAVPLETALGEATAAAAVAEGAALAAWRFRELRSNDDAEDGPSVDDVAVGGLPDGSALREGLRTGEIQARAENFARTLQARPGNVATPAHLADEATAMAERVGLEIDVLGPREMRDEGMGALLAVAAGSTEEPRLIVLEHRGGGADDRPLALVGKGLTFDAGGISIKPSKGMEEMKFDMSGGAAVLGAMQAVAELDLPLNVVGVVPSSENLPSGSAVKPGDVIRTREGKTVEVINTDAEGRLILSDALSYTRSRFDPAAIVDCATLTGSCVVALGHHASAVLGTDDALVEELRAAGDRSGERCWPLPLWDVYRKQLDSETADFKNVGGRPAGAITAACFLREFVGESAWAHLDIAGTAYGQEPPPYLRKGGYGAPTRLLVEWVRSRTG